MLLTVILGLSLAASIGWAALLRRRLCRALRLIEHFDTAYRQASAKRQSGG